MAHKVILNSRFTRERAKLLIDFIQAWGSENGVRWTQQEAA